jgi:secreted PhoX family phosphatase
MNAIVKPRVGEAVEFVDADDHINNTSGNTHFDSILKARLGRRALLAGTGGAALLGAASLAGCGGGDDPAPAPPPPATPVPVPPPASVSTALGFTAVAKSLNDVVTLPTGYTQKVIYRLGDPINATTAPYANNGTDADMEKRSGDNHDGMEYFGLNAAGTARDPLSSTRGLLAMNHEAVEDLFLHPAGPTNVGGVRPTAEIDKEVAVHGVSIIEVRLNAGQWEYVQSSAYNRRITAATPIEISGPLRGTDAMKTLYSTAGTATRGTLNNCGTGYSYWGTFLTCEENWAGYFFRVANDSANRDAKTNASLARYGRGPATSGGAQINVNSRHGWQADRTGDLYQRWDASKTGSSTDGTDDYRNAINTFGWVVEIDPYDKAAPIKKRTAMGRFAHEAAVMPKPVQGKPIAIYMGDDSRNEYMYKYVSTATWNNADATATNRMTIGDKYLDVGTLYVAKFNADGTGTWIPLTFDNPAIKNYATYAFADQADVALNTRIAADAVGATKMDRPEWGAVNPKNNDVYMTMTNNSGSNRTVATVDSANPRTYTDVKNGVNQTGNPNGHIIRFTEAGGEPGATTFNWDVYLFGAEAGADGAKVNLSGLTADNDFSSPDGLWFSPTTNICWIQTDDGAYTDVTNCMMLAGLPGTRGDGAKVTLTYDNAGVPKNVDTYVGKKPAANELKRFLVGPKACEITGVAETPDGKAMFVNVQHPGESTAAADIGDPTKFTSHWPAGGTARPQSATIVITKNDGGLVGFG